MLDRLRRFLSEVIKNAVESLRPKILVPVPVRVDRRSRK